MNQRGRFTSRRGSRLTWILSVSLGLGALVAAVTLATRYDIHPFERRAVAGASDPALPLDMAAHRRMHKAAHDRSMADHRTEPVREPWASQTAAALRADFEKLAPTGQFQLIDIECRSSTCLTTLEWRNYDIASKKWPTVLNNAYSAPCGTRVFLDDPASAETAYRSTVITTCQQPAATPPNSDERP